MTKKLYSFAVLATALIYAPIALSQGCFEKSPSYKKQGDAYFETLSFNDTERARNIPSVVKHYLKLMEDLEGTWKGNSTAFICEGTDRSPRKENKDATVTYKLELNKDKTIKHLFERLNKAQQITRNETLSIADLESKVEPKEFFYVVLDRGKNSVTLQTKYRQISVGLNRFRENLLSFKLADDKKNLIINNTHYQQGVLVSDEKINLTLDRKR